MSRLLPTASTVSRSPYPLVVAKPLQLTSCWPPCVCSSDEQLAWWLRLSVLLWRTPLTAEATSSKTCSGAVAPSADPRPQPKSNGVVWPIGSRQSPLAFPPAPRTRATTTSSPVSRRGCPTTKINGLKEQDTRIANAATRLTEDSFRKRLQRMRDRMGHDHGATATDQAIADSFAGVSLTRDRSSCRLSGQLDALRGSAVQAALARECRWLYSQPELVAGLDSDQAMAQALHDLILRGESIDRETGSTRPNVSVLVLTDRQTMESGPHDGTIAETEDGTRLNPATIGRLCCDTGLRRLDVLPDPNVHVSHSGRTATPAHREALRAMYISCPISRSPWSQCEVHHVVFYRHGERTVLSELVPISRRWHHLVHEGGWTLTINAERPLTLSRPDGTIHKTIPYQPASLSTAAAARTEHLLAA